MLGYLIFLFLNSNLTTSINKLWVFAGTPFIKITKLLVLFVKTPFSIFIKKYLEPYHAGNTRLEGDTALPNSASSLSERIQWKNYSTGCGDT